jgi:alpha/beta superfamily hydrolase
MRRPHIEEFVSIAAPANRFDFSFLAPWPPSDLFIMAISTGWRR